MMDLQVGHGSTALALHIALGSHLGSDSEDNLITLAPSVTSRFAYAGVSSLLFNMGE